MLAPTTRAAGATRGSLCSGSLPVSGAGLALMTDAGPAGTVAATDGPAAGLEELQFTLGEGPCVDASRTGRPVLQPDLARTASARWPAFADGAQRGRRARGLRLPPAGGGHPRRRARPLPGHRRAGSPGRADRGPGLRRRGDRPAAAPAGPGRRRRTCRWTPCTCWTTARRCTRRPGPSRVQAGVSLAEALVLLRARAYAEQRLIRELARDVLDGVVHFRPDDGRWMHAPTMTHRRRPRYQPRREESMAREQRLAQVFVELADTMVEEFDVVDFLQVLTERCVELVDTDAAGTDARRPARRPAGGRLHRRIGAAAGAVRAAAGGGALPGLLRHRRVIANIDLADAGGRWPVFAEAARDDRLRACHTPCRCACGSR